MKICFLVVIALLVCSATVFALGNETNSTQPVPMLISANTNVTAALANVTVPVVNTTNETKHFIPNANFTILSFVPKEFKVGDIQFNIQIQNTGNVELRNLVAIINGKGFAMTDTVPIDNLKPGEKSYVIVMGSVKDEGVKTLAIRINEKLFYQNISVFDPDSAAYKAQQAELQKQAEIKAAALTSLTQTLATLKKNFSEMQTDFAKKQNENYDLSSVKLDDLKQFIRTAEASIIAGDAKQANISVNLALDEFTSQKTFLANAKVIKKPFMDIIKDNILVFSTIAGALITIFSLYEILKKKKDALLSKTKENKAAVEGKKPEHAKKAHKTD